MSQEKKFIKIVEIRGEKYDAFEYGNDCGVCCFAVENCCPVNAISAIKMCDRRNNIGFEVYYQPHTEKNSIPTEVTVTVKDALLYISRTYGYENLATEEEFLSDIAEIKQDIESRKTKEIIRSKLTQEEIDYIRANGV